MVELNPTSPRHDNTHDDNSLQGQDPPIAMQQHLEQPLQLAIKG